MSHDDGMLELGADDLPAWLDRPSGPVRAIRVLPSSSWARLKPLILPRLRAWGAARRRPPALVGYPKCAIGDEFPTLPPSPPGPWPAPAACASCGEREGCSPPPAWHAELQPFGPRDLEARWQRFHRRFAELAGLAVDGRLDRALAAILSARRGPLANAPWALEPSVLFAPMLVPAVRLAVFQGDVRRDDPRGGMALLLDAFAALHEAAGAPVPRALLDRLRAAPPCPFPLGFDARPGAELLLKGYLRVEHLAPVQRQELVAAFAAAPAGIPFERVDMIGLGTQRGELASLKLYVRADPCRAELGLEALPASDPLVSLAGGRAYAVVDLLHPEKRPPKWDLPLRAHLLSGPMLPSVMADLSSAAAIDQLRALVDHREFRVDCVAAGRRGSDVALYLELG